MKIEHPGIFADMPSAAYFSDPCPTASLTQSVAKILLEKSPLHAWHAHPRLNPDYRHDDATKFDVGNVAHKLLLGRGKEIVVLDFDDWRTKAAKEQRDEAAASGKLAVLGKHMAKAEAMVKAAHEQLDLRGLDLLFTEGHGNGEVVTAWREGDIWLRQMIDWLTPDLWTFVDFKTTEMSAAPDGLGRMMVNAGWQIQAAMGERGLDVLDPKGAGRRQYLFVVQEVEKPYALSVVAIGEAALTIGRKQLSTAVDIWSRCIREDRWPGYPTDITVPQLPGWFETQWLEREVDEEDRRTAPRRRDDLTIIGAG